MGNTILNLLVHTDSASLRDNVIVPSYSSDVHPVIKLVEFDSGNPCAWSEDLVLPDHSEAFSADVPVEYTVQRDLSQFLGMEQLADEASEPGLSPSSVGCPLEPYDTLDDMNPTLEPAVTCIVPQLGGCDQTKAESLAQWQIVSPTDEELHCLRINTRAAAQQTQLNTRIACWRCGRHLKCNITLRFWNYSPVGTP